VSAGDAHVFAVFGDGAARRLAADYYVAGFISPLGEGVSVVEQVVGTGSGIVLFSSSAQLSTYADAAGQGDHPTHASAGPGDDRGLALEPHRCILLANERLLEAVAFPRVARYMILRRTGRRPGVRATEGIANARPVLRSTCRR